MTTSQTLSAAEIVEGRAYLQRACDRVLSATAGLSEAQWGYRASEGNWSAGEIVEHMALVQEVVLGPIAQALAGAPETVGLETATVDEIVKTRFIDRSRKFPAPEMVRPTGRWAPAESLERVSANTGRMMERLETTPGLRLHRVPAAPLKAISGGAYELADGYQWILAAAAHTDRHVNQILELKTQPGFPAR
jgi:hypothetical protein